MLWDVFSMRFVVTFACIWKGLGGLLLVKSRCIRIDEKDCVLCIFAIQFCSFKSSGFKEVHNFYGQISLKCFEVTFRQRIWMWKCSFQCLFGVGIGDFFLHLNELASCARDDLEGFCTIQKKWCIKISIVFRAFAYDLKLWFLICKA